MLAAAATRLPSSVVLDGELVIWNGSRLDFDALQRRLAGGAARIAHQARTHPASYMVFDVLAWQGGICATSRGGCAAGCSRSSPTAWVPPLQLSPVTDDVEVARAWMRDFRPAGIEGLVVKGAATRYVPGQRGWVKVRSRETAEVIVGAVIGPLEAPEAIVAGRFRDGVLRMVGRSSALTLRSPGRWRGCWPRPGMVIRGRTPWRPTGSAAPTAGSH